MVEISKVKTVKVEAKEMRLCVKVRDYFTGNIVDQDGERIGDFDGYVPSFFPGNHDGDYIKINIDLDTGQITNWKKPTAEDIEKLIEKQG